MEIRSCDRCGCVVDISQMHQKSKIGSNNPELVISEYDRDDYGFWFFCPACKGRAQVYCD